MTTTQLEILLNLYKKAINNILYSKDLDSYLKRAKIDLDQSFVQTGKEDASIKKYIEELNELKNLAI
jgi:hypothetical protein